jgi:hypothetical protein
LFKSAMPGRGRPSAGWSATAKPAAPGGTMRQEPARNRGDRRPDHHAGAAAANVRQRHPAPGAPA